MQTVLDSLPGQPLDPTDIEAINEAASFTLVPYTWRGSQVITLLLDTDDQISGGRFEPPTEDRRNVIGSSTETGASDEDSRGSSDRSIEFDTGDDGPIGTVEILETESFAPEEVEFRRTGRQESGENSGEKQDESDHSTGSPIPAMGYDSSGTTWVLIDELEAGTSLQDAEPIIREWLTNTYQEQMVDHFDVGPSEYELSSGD